MAQSDYIRIIVAIVALIFSGALSAFLSMFTFAIASYKFAMFSNKTSVKEIDATAKRLLYSSDKIASLVGLAKRLLSIFSVVMLYMLFDTIFANAFGNEIGHKLLCFLPIVAIVLWLQFVLLEMTTAKYGKYNADTVMIKYAKLFYSVYILMMPLYFLSRAINGKLTKNMRKGEGMDFESIDVELMLSARENESGSISQYAGKIVRNALKMQEMDVSDVMLPRSKVVYFDVEKSNAENLEIAMNTHHTRYPLCRKNLDDCVGIVHIKDIFMRNENSDELDFMRIRRETLRIKENEKLETVLTKLLKYNLQMAVVEDEFGGVIGVVTLDSALSELVGQIKDEFYSETNQESVRRISKNKYKVFGATPLRKVEDFLDVDFDDNQASTFGGLITSYLGRFPEANEQIYLEEQKIEVVVNSVNERSVNECTISRKE